MKILLVISFFLAIGIGAQNGPQKATVQYRQTAGTDAGRLSLDIYTPSGAEGRPVVIFVHGGAWFLGDKATKIGNKVQLFNTLGYVLVSVNYRLSSFFNTGLQYPAHAEDVADAVAWVFKNIKNYGGNPDKIVLMGHSAGAQMVSLLGTSPEFLPKRGIRPELLKGVISIDTEGYDVYGMANSGVKIYRRIFGEDPEVWKRASPIRCIEPGKSYPPFLIVARGKPYRLEMADRFAAALRGAGAEAEVFSTDAYSHFGINNKIGKKNEAVITPKLTKFLSKVLK